MARKFKRKLARKQVRSKEAPVLAITLVRKETVEKIKTIWKKITSKAKVLKFAN